VSRDNYHADDSSGVVLSWLVNDKTRQKMRKYANSSVAGMLLSISTFAASAADVSGAKDHPLLTRFAGAVISTYSQTAFDEAVLPNQAIDAASSAKGLNLAGKVTRIVYTINGDKSTLEVERNYLDALQTGGLQILFRCTREQCGKGAGNAFQDYVANSQKVMPPGGPASFGGAHRSILAKLARPTGDAYIFLHIMDDSASNHRTLVFEEVVEERAMQTGQVKILDAGAMQNGLASTGKVALYALYFDTDKAQIKPESNTQLGEMAKLLTANPDLKVYIVGHTDNQGQYAHNIDLSQKRAEAVVQALTTTYHVAPSRLAAKGIASLSPVAANSDDAGRTQNRRVELVQQ
jgi:outer membrane protein OmpA-like peptidoglycan-associated protein